MVGWHNLEVAFGLRYPTGSSPGPYCRHNGVAKQIVVDEAAGHGLYCRHFGRTGPDLLRQEGATPFRPWPGKRR